MASFEEKVVRLETELNRVVEWNTIAGKADVIGKSQHEMAMALTNQRERVFEECNELAATLSAKLKGETDGRDFYVRLVDDLCDILVTSSFYRFMEGKPMSVTTDRVSASLIERVDEINLENSYQFLSMLALQETPQFNLINAFRAVNDNNFEKFIRLTDPLSSRIISETIEMYDEQGEETTVLYNSGYAVILRTSDNKVMKPAGFIGVDLHPFIFV